MIVIKATCDHCKDTEIEIDFEHANAIGDYLTSSGWGFHLFMIDFMLCPKCIEFKDYVHPIYQPKCLTKPTS